MLKHTDLECNENGKIKLRQLMREGKIALGGNIILKIYGTLQCKSGKRMLKKNRVFFASEAEALAAKYRPCAHCMRNKYLIWKASNQ